MKPKLILYLALVLSGGLFGCSNIACAQDKPDWSPINTTVEVGGIIAVPPEYRQKLDLPERISFDIKMNSVAERIRKTERSKASVHYFVVLKNIGTNLVYLDMTNMVSDEVTGVPQQAVEQVTKSVINPIVMALKMFVKPVDSKVSTTNTIALSNLSTNTLVMSTNDIVIEKLKLKENGKKVLDYPPSP
jgi:hypothetical protein